MWGGRARNRYDLEGSEIQKAPIAGVEPVLTQGAMAND